jgi:hypothetical protein
MIDPFGGALTGQFVILPQEGRQPQGFQVMGESSSCGVSLMSPPASRLR